MINKKLFAVLLMCAPFALFAQTAPEAPVGDLPHVAITGFENRTNDEVFDIPAKTATDSLVLTLKLLGMYEVIERDALAALPENANDAALGDWCDANGYDYYIYGTIALGSGGSQKYKLSVFDRSKRKTVINETAKGESVLDVFSASDLLAGSVIDSVTGRHIGFGSINFLTISAIEGCQVYLDGIKAAETLDPIDRVVAGTHTVVVKQKTGFSSVTILEQEIEIAEGQTVRVDVIVPTDANQAEQTWVTFDNNKKRKYSICTATTAVETIKGVEYLTQSVKGWLLSLHKSNAGIVMKPSRSLLERLKAADGLAFRIQGDRQPYIICVETSDITDGNYYSFFFFANKSEREVFVPYNKLTQGEGGKKRPFIKDHITGITIMPAMPHDYPGTPISFYFKVYGFRPE